MSKLTARLRRVAHDVKVNPEIYLGERVGVAGHTLGHVSDAWTEKDNDGCWIVVEVTVPEPE